MGKNPQNLTQIKPLSFNHLPNLQPSFFEFERSAGVPPLRGGFAPTPPCSQPICERYSLTNH